jgi:tripartite-type tricarboxylate transporter receptor subunit TctC
MLSTLHTRSRRWCVLVLAVLAFGAGSAAAQPSSYPARPVRIVVPAAAGGPADVLGRLVAERLGRLWNQALVIENKPGASLMLGTDAVAKAAPDGYTLLLTPDGPITINPALFPKMPYDPQKDLVPAAKVVTLPLMLVVHPDVPARNVTELVALIKAQPGKLNYGAGGSTTRIAAELFRITTGTDMVHVPYKGSGPMVNALLGNEVQLAFDGISSSLGQVRAGKLRALAVTGSSRLPGLPQVPTVAESGYPGYQAGTWIGLFAPAGTPSEVLAKLHEDFAKVMAQPDLVARLSELGMTPAVAGADAFAEQVRADTAKWTQLIRKAGITADN